MKQKWEYKLLGLYHVNELCMINIKSLGVIIFCKSVSDYSSQVFCFVLFKLTLESNLSKSFCRLECQGKAYVETSEHF